MSEIIVLDTHVWFWSIATERDRFTALWGVLGFALLYPTYRSQPNQQIYSPPTIHEVIKVSSNYRNPEPT